MRKSELISDSLAILEKCCVYKIAMVLFLILIAGCATRPVSNSEAVPVPDVRILESKYSSSITLMGNVNIKRDSGVFGSACTTRLYINSVPVADIQPSEILSLNLPSSEYIFSVWPNGVCGGGMSEVKSTVTTNSITNLRIGYGSNGDFYINHTAF